MENREDEAEQDEQEDKEDELDDDSSTDMPVAAPSKNFAEAQKPSSHCIAVQRNLHLAPDLPFDTLKAQVLEQIAAALQPAQISYEDYTICFSIPYHIKNGLLKTLEDYETLMAKVGKMKSPSCCLDITQIHQEAGHADENTPPNHYLFDAMDPRSLVKKLLLLQTRLQQHKDQGQVPTITIAPVVHVNIPNDLLQPFPLAPAPQPLGNGAIPLIPSHLIPGPNMDIEAFCDAQQLSHSICDCLLRNKFMQAHGFEFVTVQDLKDMGLVFGDIADLKNAVRSWSVAHNH
ncbi:hypothetical protein ARMGADRAFT_1091082 [Armillaria gallica]|uniref:Uncharacterized protein n=1 Tax=Armillaria gallica TaxID=47427 RepID=A0A2H3CTA8_ARMGA|nr:hypothetical protein ARMGADRAFT_1091082 [Armillaria gallica]